MFGILYLTVRALSLDCEQAACVSESKSRRRHTHEDEGRITSELRGRV